MRLHIQKRVLVIRQDPRQLTRDFHSDFSADNHTHPDGDIHEQITHTRTATLPTGEKVTIEERSTTYEHGHPPGQDPAPRDGERVTVTTTSVSSQHDLNVRNTVTWTEHGDRTVNAEITLRHSFEGMGRTSEETGHQREVSGGVDKGTNQHGAIQGDHAGHIAAHRFMLDQGLPNLFPQNGNFNTSAYKTMENEWAALVNDGLEIEGEISLSYSESSSRPDKVKIDFSGVVTNLDDSRSVVFEPADVVRFLNDSGQDYNRSYPARS